MFVYRSQLYYNSALIYNKIHSSPPEHLVNIYLYKLYRRNVLETSKILPLQYFYAKLVVITGKKGGGGGWLVLNISHACPLT